MLAAAGEQVTPPPEPLGPQCKKPRQPAPGLPGPITDSLPGGARSSRRGRLGRDPHLPPPHPESLAPSDAPAASGRGSGLDDSGQQHEQWVLQPGGGTGGLLLHCQDHLFQECAEQTSLEGKLNNTRDFHCGEIISVV